MIKSINMSGKKVGTMFNKQCIEKDTQYTESESESAYKKISMKPEELKRVSCEKWNLSERCFTHTYQFCEISKLYLNVEDSNVEHRGLILKELTNKIAGYKRQDIEKKVFQDDLFISLENVIEKLLCSKLKCFYCKQCCEVLYKNVYSKQQWTLDRLNNDIGHNTDNVIISCLECNLKRGTMNSDRFKYGKQIGLTFRKVDC